MKKGMAVAGMLLLGASTLGAQQRQTILFIGNSFTFGSGSAVRYWRGSTVTDLNNEGVGGVPALFDSFAGQVGLDYDVHLETRGGSGFEFHLADKRAELSSRPWDIVVVHGQSLLDLQIPRDTTKFLRTAQEMVDFLESVNSRTQIYMTATWSRADETYPDDAAWRGEPIEAMARDVRAAYDIVKSRDSAVKSINPVGEAWNRAFAMGVADPNPYDGIDADQLDLWTFDHYHASTAGYYLHALVVFGNVTGVDPRSLGRGECSAYELGLSGAQAEALQRVAYEELTAQRIATRTVAGREPPTRGARCAAA
jgi:hypothetical protein